MLTVKHIQVLVYQVHFLHHHIHVFGNNPSVLYVKFHASIISFNTLIVFVFRAQSFLNLILLQSVYCLKLLNEHML